MWTRAFHVLNTPASIQGYDYANQFVACLCEGKNINGNWGNDTMTQAAGICQSCSTTAREIKANLSVSAHLFRRWLGFAGLGGLLRMS